MKAVGLRSKVQVIVVEDDYTYLSFWRRFLLDLGITDCLFISNAYEAKEKLLEYEYELLISDINMQGLNGYFLSKIACTKNPFCSIILTTAYHPHLSRFDIDNCIFHLLFKPFSNLEELGKLIKHLINHDDSFDDLSEDSYSENEEYPLITEWKL